MAQLRLSKNQVDIWRIDLAGTPEEIQRCRGLLSSEELLRANRFHLNKHRRRFIVARAAMRQVLSRYLSVAPQDLVFSYSDKGKPEFPDKSQEAEIKFNLSHSCDLALFAVTETHRVGVDIESVNRELAIEEIAERFFSAGEVNTLRATLPGERAEAFFSCWTRKEAYIKAVGHGLSAPLDSFEEAFGRGVPAALLHVRTDPTEARRWSIYDIHVAEGYKAALAVEGNGHKLWLLPWGFTSVPMSAQ
jgi:4'-phosphopantetheinyl transferase